MPCTPPTSGQVVPLAGVVHMLVEQEAVAVEVSAADPGGLLVDWLNEVLWLTETRRARVAGVRVERVGDGMASGSVVLASGGPAPEGTFVKAVTYHRLRVEPDPAGGWLAEVYVDV